MKESDLYEPVKQWLDSRGYGVYSEVSPEGDLSRADVVGICDKDIIVVELKLSLSLELLDQAVNWSQKRYANYIYIAVPWNKKGRQPYINNWLIKHICREFNIGIIFVRTGYLKDNYLFIDEKPYLTSKYQSVDKRFNFRKQIEKFKREYDKSDLKGGQKGGGFITPYKVTVDRLKEFLSAARYQKRFSVWWYENGEMIDLRQRNVDGWLDIKTILDYCETHWASPKGSLANALVKYENDWCECKKEKGKLYFRYKGEEIENNTF